MICRECALSPQRSFRGTGGACLYGATICCVCLSYTCARWRRSQNGRDLAVSVKQSSLSNAMCSSLRQPSTAAAAARCARIQKAMYPELRRRREVLEVLNCNQQCGCTTNKPQITQKKTKRPGFSTGTGKVHHQPSSSVLLFLHI